MRSLAQALLVLAFALCCFIPFSSGQNLDDLPIDDATKQYLESLPPDQLAAILEIYNKGLKGQTPASPDVIEAQELRYSYNSSPPFYPTRKLLLSNAHIPSTNVFYSPNKRPRGLGGCTPASSADGF